MRRIDSLQQLREEKRRLRLHAQTLEGNLKSDWSNVKESLAPANMLFKTFNNSVSGVKPNLLNETMNTGIDLILRRLILRNRGILIKLIVPYLVKNFTGNYIKTHRTDIFSWLRNKFSGLFSKNGQDKLYDQSTADVNTTSW
jgi:hypothetical protein